MTEPRPYVNRFAPFSPDELSELWEALITDDGAPSAPVEMYEPDAYRLAVELRAEARSRGITLPNEWAADG